MNKLIILLSILILAGCANNSTNKSPNAKIEWNFSKKRKLTYSFLQTVETKDQSSKDFSIEKTYVNVTGNLSVQAKEDTLADLSLTELEMQIIMFNTDGIPKDTITQNSPSIVREDMTPNGKFKIPSDDMLFDILFPMPNMMLVKGKSIEIPLEIPFNANGNLLYSKGQNTISFDRFEEFLGRDCVVLKGELNISKLKIPEHLDGLYESSTLGNATYYFDLENGFYVGSDVTMVMDMLIDNQSEDTKKFGMYMKTKNENNYSVKLKYIDE